MDNYLQGYLAALLLYKVYYGTDKGRPYMKYRSYISSEDHALYILKVTIGGTISDAKSFKGGKKHWDWTCYDLEPIVKAVNGLRPYSFSLKDEYSKWLKKHFNLTAPLNMRPTDIALSWDSDRQKKEADNRLKKEEVKWEYAKKENTSIYKEEKINNKEGASKMKEQEERAVVKEEVKKMKIFS